MTTASILALVESIEQRGADAPAALAFRSALIRKLREAHSAGGPITLDAIRREITVADPRRAKTRTAILAAAWSGLLESNG